MATTTTAVELRTMSDDDLAERLREAKEELFNLRFQAATGQLESHGRLRAVRRDIARVYTVLRERELGIIDATHDEPTTGDPGDEDEDRAAAASSGDST